VTAGPGSIEEQLLDRMHARLGSRARLEDRLDALGVDSLQLADFVADLEKAFDFRADQDIFDVETVAELAAYIRAQRER
jgi:acyl carrier protein